MAPTSVTYIGLVVAGLIFLWAIIEIARRYFLQNRLDPRKNIWVPFKPHATVDPEDALAPEDDPQRGHGHAGSHSSPARTPLQSRAQQNGHYSKSKKAH